MPRPNHANGRLGSAAHHCDGLARYHELPQVNGYPFHPSEQDMISAAGIKDQELTIIVSMMLIELALLRLSRFKRLALLDTQGLEIFAASFEDMSMTSPTWRALGQVVLVYFAVGGAAVTAQDAQPGRATFAEMIAFARLASVPCQRLAPDADSFDALALRRLIKPPITEEEIAAKEKDIKRHRVRLGLSSWCKRYAGQMEQARILVQVLRRQN
jgi:hypothetical protein